MNRAVAKNRIKEVLRPDTITTSQGDFFATHVPMQTLYHTTNYMQGNYQPKDRTTEEKLYRELILNPDERHQLILVVGQSGTGKSHLIRWFHAKLDQEKNSNEVVLFVRRSDNTLKGTIKQLLQIPEVQEIPNKDMYERLVSATAVVDRKKLKATIYQTFIVEIQFSEITEDARSLSTVERKRLVALMQNDMFEERMMAKGGPIDRIFSKIDSSAIGSNEDVVAEFYASDFDIDYDFCEELIDTADKNAIKMAKAIMTKPEEKEKIAAFLNRMLNAVIQRCAGLEPGDFEQVFQEIRRELKKKGKNLTLLIEDITAFTGVDHALLNVLVIGHTGMYSDGQMCRISSILGITNGYYDTNFPDNLKDRVTDYIGIPDNAFSLEYLYEFFAKYINTMSLESDEIDTWVNNGAQDDEYPIAKSEIEEGWDHIVCSNGKMLNLFPFSKHAISFLYDHILKKNHQTPRYIMRDIIEPIAYQALGDLKAFPSSDLQKYNDNVDVSLRPKVFGLDIAEEEKERLFLFTCIWGDGTATVSFENGEEFISSINKKAYISLGLPLLDGLKQVSATNQPKVKSVVLPDTESNKKAESPVTTETKKTKDLLQEQNSRISKSLHDLERWLSGGPINVGATTSNVVFLTNARDDIKDFILSAIDWQVEGVSIDNINKIKSSRYNLIGFENQTKGLDQTLYIMPASRESAIVIEAFVRWRQVGGESWDFAGADYLLYQVQLWLERVKPEIVKLVTSNGDKAVNYNEYAVTAEVYRQILFGQLKASSASGITLDTLLSNEIKSIPETTGHSKEWMDLLSFLKRKDEDKINRDTAIQFYNIVQGGGGTRVYIDRDRFEKTLSKLIKQGFVVPISDKGEEDLIATRDAARRHTLEIVTRINKIIEAEDLVIENASSTISGEFGKGELSSKEIEQFADTTNELYDVASDAKYYLHYDADLITSVKRNRNAIEAALKTVEKIKQTDEQLNKLLLMSTDPIKKIQPLCELILKVRQSVDHFNQESTRRKESLVGVDLGEAEKYSRDIDSITESKKLLS